MILCKKTFCLYKIWKLSLALLVKSQKIFYNNSAAIFFEVLKCKIILQISYLFLCRLSFLIACVYTSTLRCKGAKSLGSCLLHKIRSWSLWLNEKELCQTIGQFTNEHIVDLSLNSYDTKNIMKFNSNISKVKVKFLSKTFGLHFCKWYSPAHFQKLDVLDMSYSYIFALNWFILSRSY